MDNIDYVNKLQALEKSNRILQKKLERTELHQLELDEANQRKEALLKQLLQEVQESQRQFAQLNEELEQRVEHRTSELKQALDNLQQTQLQLVQNEKMSALGNLVAGVAHEINNPIGFISGNLNAVKLGLADLIDHFNLYSEKLPGSDIQIQAHAEEIDLEFLLEDLPKMLASMELGCDRIVGISNSLRTFSRADTAQKVEADIHEGLDSTLMILQHRLKATNLRPTIQVVKHYGKLPKIKCFLGQLNQVFMNILANAIDALEDTNLGRSFDQIEAQPNQITICTEIFQADRQAIIRIQDNGAGMPDAVKEKNFDHLFTTKDIGKGTGLGLAIAQSIVVEKHGGSLFVNSKLGHGTEFIIMLPT